MNQISSRAYIDIEVSKYYKINLGKTIFWQWLLKTHEEYYKKLQNWQFWGLYYLAQTGFGERKSASKVSFITLPVTSIWLIRFSPTNLMNWYKTYLEGFWGFLQDAFVASLLQCFPFARSIFLIKSSADSNLTVTPIEYPVYRVSDQRWWYK